MRQLVEHTLALDAAHRFHMPHREHITVHTVTLTSTHTESFAAVLNLLAHRRKMKNAEKLAASTKQPKYPVYEEGGRIIWIRPGERDSCVMRLTFLPGCATLSLMHMTEAALKDVST